MFGLGIAEIAVVGAVVTVLFAGPALVRRVARTLGESVREGKKAVDDVRESFR